MKRGRRADADHVQEAKGNPGKRKRARAKSDAQPPLIDDTTPGLESQKNSTLYASPPAELAGDAEAKVAARVVWHKVGAELANIGFLKASDHPLFARYCQNLADYWIIDRLLRAGNLVNDVPMTNGGTMPRLNPYFTAQERLERRLQWAEPRLGIGPADRQQVLYRLSQGAGAPAALPLPIPDGSPRPETPTAPQHDDDDPIGILGSSTPPTIN